jgi:hypothetical protein
VRIAAPCHPLIFLDLPLSNGTMPIVDNERPDINSNLSLFFGGTHARVKLTD